MEMFTLGRPDPQSIPLSEPRSRAGLAISSCSSASASGTSLVTGGIGVAFLLIDRGFANGSTTKLTVLTQLASLPSPRGDF